MKCICANSLSSLLSKLANVSANLSLAPSANAGLSAAATAALSAKANLSLSANANLAAAANLGLSLNATAVADVSAVASFWGPIKLAALSLQLGARSRPDRDRSGKRETAQCAV